MTKRGPNATPKERAESLATTIKVVWRERGYRVRVTVVPYALTGQRAHYAIKSDLVNGLPRGYRGSLHDLAAVMARPDPPDTSAIRSCMGCGQDFESAHRHNRLCERCNRRAVGVYRGEGRTR